MIFRQDVTDSRNVPLIFSSTQNSLFIVTKDNAMTSQTNDVVFIVTFLARAVIINNVCYQLIFKQPGFFQSRCNNVPLIIFSSMQNSLFTSESRMCYTCILFILDRARNKNTRHGCIRSFDRVVMATVIETARLDDLDRVLYLEPV